MLTKNYPVEVIWHIRLRERQNNLFSLLGDFVVMYIETNQMLMLFKFFCHFFPSTVILKHLYSVLKCYSPLFLVLGMPKLIQKARQKPLLLQKKKKILNALNSFDLRANIFNIHTTSRLKKIFDASFWHLTLRKLHYFIFFQLAIYYSLKARYSFAS